MTAISVLNLSKQSQQYQFTEENRMCDWQKTVRSEIVGNNENMLFHHVEVNNEFLFCYS